jgi:hypothetical protein
MKGIKELVESYKRKFNPTDGASGVKAVNREIGLLVKGLVESKKLVPEQVSLRHLWEALDVETALEEGNIVSSAFPTIAGQLISTKMIEGYTMWQDDTAKLVTEVPSKLKISNIVGWTNVTGVERVNERQDYPQLKPPSEKAKTIHNYKYGGLLDLTKEAIFFDQTGELLNQAREVGAAARRKRMRLIWDAIVDANATAYSGGDLYSSGNGNVQTANPLGGEGSWETTRAKLMAQTDENGEPIWVFGDRPILVVPSGLLATAEKLQKNPTGALGTANLDVNLAQGQFDIVVNPYLSASSTTWWYGAPSRQFRWETVWPFEVFTRIGQDSEEGFKADVIQQFKASFFGGVGAVDTKYVVQNEAA